MAAGQLRRLGAADDIESTPDGWWNLDHQPDEYVDSRWEQIATAEAEDVEEAAAGDQPVRQVDQAWFVPMVYMGTQLRLQTRQGKSSRRVRTRRL